ncbi:Dna2/Cas4 domain-containing protein [Mucilaginibacter sp. AW1-7]|uniref:Dna2/Cas4 domain-containing protein n=1 Tax=Mucilaginibacter sp. AW1-7 TaxID=3349874 RepID=UPI003F73F948
MRVSICNDIILDFLNCRHKAYLKINCINGTISDFQKFREGSKEILKSKLLHKILSPPTSFDLEGTNISFKKIKFNNFDVSFDSFEVSEAQTGSTITPIELFCSIKINRTEKLYLVIKTLIFELVLNKQITTIKVYNSLFQEIKIKVNNEDRRIAKKLIHEIEHLYDSNVEPPLYQIKECVTCEYCERCLKYLKDKDDLSLLGGINISNITKYHNKGIFSINQLSYTFRPRKYKNNVIKKHFPELKALAIRESKIYIWNTPEIRNAESEFYVDIEFIPDEDLIYLIGVIHSYQGNVHHHYFWMDSNLGFEQNVAELLKLLFTSNDSVIYHYGSAEYQFFSQLKKKGYRINLDQLIDVLPFIVNKYW